MNEDKRETKEIITPVDKHKVILKSFITGREKRDMKNIYFEGVEFELQGAGAKSNKMDMAKITEKSENKAIETLVVSVNGNSDKIVDTVLDMKSKDSDFVIAEMNKVTEDDFLSPEPKNITEQIK